MQRETHEKAILRVALIATTPTPLLMMAFGVWPSVTAIAVTMFCLSLIALCAICTLGFLDYKERKLAKIARLASLATN